MPTHNGTSEAVRAVLSSGGTYGVKELTEAVREAGIADATEVGVRRIADTRCAVGEYLKERENGSLVYRVNPDWSAPRKGRAPRAADPAQVDAAVRAIGEKVAPVIQKPLAAGLGVGTGPVALAGDRIAPLDAAVRALFVDRLSTDTAYSARDVAQELGGGWRLGDVQIALYEGVTRGWLQVEYSHEEENNVFQWAPSEPQAPAAGPTPATLPSSTPTPTLAPALSARPVVDETPPSPIPGIGDVEPRAGDEPPLQPLGLRERLAVIVADLEDAIGDACDERLPHPVIKALVAANGATQRALRSLAA